METSKHKASLSGGLVQLRSTVRCRTQPNGAPFNEQRTYTPIIVMSELPAILRRARKHPHMYVRNSTSANVLRTLQDLGGKTLLQLSSF